MTQTSQRILIIDDDDQNVRSISSALRSENYQVSVACDSRQAMQTIDRDPPDLIVIERFLKAGNAIDSCISIRRNLAAPLIMLSRNGTESTVIEALDAGADDFVRKPVPPGEFLARVRALLRRSASGSFRPSVLTCGSLELDQRKRECTIAGDEIRLTRTEFDILRCLMEKNGRTVSYNSLLQYIWGSNPEEGVRALRVHIAHLRKKIEADPANPRLILTDPGRGYRVDSTQLANARASTAG